MDFELFKKNIRKIRSSQGLSAKALAEKAELKQKKRILDFEEGRGIPTLEEVCSVCKALGYNIDDMLYKEAVVNIDFKNVKINKPS